MGTILFVGDLRGSSDDYAKRARVPKRSELFRRSDLNAAFANITAFHAASGERVSVAPEVQLDAETHVVDLTVRVTVLRP